MEFTIVDSANVIFKNARTSTKNTTLKLAIVSADTLKQSRPGSLKSLNLLDKLTSLLLANRLSGNNLQKLSEPMDCELSMELFFGPIPPNNPTHNTFCQVEDRNSSDGLFKRLWWVCGGSSNITADIELNLMASNDTMKIIFNDVAMLNDLCFGEEFNLTKSLAQKWDKQVEFLGKLSITLKLNAKATNFIHLGNQSKNALINRKLLIQAKDSGDMVITAQNGEKVECHKAFLIAQSDVFKAMFTNDMQEAQTHTVTMTDISEAGVRALLGFLYCYDIEDALISAQIAVELLMAADKYAIEKLFRIMKDIILDKNNSLFSVASAVRLLILVGNKEEENLKGIEDKAKTILQSKSAEQLKQFKEFRELFNNPDNGISMFMYLMQIKCTED